MIVSMFFTKLHTLIFVDFDVIEDFAIPKAFFFKSPRYILGQNELQFDNIPLDNNQVGNSLVAINCLCGHVVPIWIKKFKSSLKVFNCRSVMMAWLCNSGSLMIFLFN